jgi:alpha-beta hydrolase superfamily lysophospholipase
MWLGLRRHLVRNLVRLAVLLLALPPGILLLRAFDARGMPDLELWHQVELLNEFHSGDDHDGMTFDDYLKLEDSLFQELNEKVYDVYQPPHDNLLVRYVRQSPSDPGRFDSNWNRSFELVPEKIRGGILLLHGLTDSPYSLRKIAQVFFDNGYYVLCPRMPGHGTTPSSLVDLTWHDWTPVVEMAAHQVISRIGDDDPFYVGGYSNGGALTVKFTLDSLEHDLPRQPDKLFLFSPAIGVTRYATFANWHKIVSFLPYFEKFRWHAIGPEYDPFKYNSFPKNAGDQAHLLSKAVQSQLERLESSGGLQRLPPMVTFQSVVDSTVASDEVVNSLYSRLDQNGSELVLFDVNRSAQLQQFLRQHCIFVDDLLAVTSLPYTLTVVGNTSNESSGVVARTRVPGVDETSIESLDLDWPRQVYSLSHVAIPFSPEDPVYGAGPQLPGVNHLRIGALEPRGERDLLAIPAEQLMRLRYNPFFDYMKRRIVHHLMKN